jgi:hypothetical protein
MSLQIAPFSSLVLALSWQSDPGVTYTLQTSPDLQNWDPLPYVVTGDGSVVDYYLEQASEVRFARLRHSPDGDTNENGLPDHWEWVTFGYLDVDPLADPDGDGLSNYAEWLGQSDPHNFYNGVVPVIKVASGGTWLVAAGQLSSEALAIRITTAAGHPLGHSPVRIIMRSGHAGIVPVDGASPQAVNELVVITDNLGRISPGILSIHMLAHPEVGRHELLDIVAGPASENLAIVSVGDDFGKPPRNLSLSSGPAGETVYSWSGDPGLAGRFFLEEQSGPGQWIRLADLAVTELPQPGEADGLYRLILD